MSAKKADPPKPEAVPIALACSVCGLPWESHGEDATIEDCVVLLRTELAKASRGPWGATGVASQLPTAGPLLPRQPEVK